MRLFIAIDLDQEDYFKQIQGQIPESKATYPKAFHLTLQFLGETEKKEEIINELNKIEFQSFQLKTTKIGVFPAENYIKVVWLGLEENSDLTKLQKDIEKALDKFNFKKDHNFHPHVTLARIKFIRQEDKKEFTANLKEIKFVEKVFEVETFKLIKSELTRQGSVYDVVAVFSAK